MESTGVYWIPLFGVLEEREFRVMLVSLSVLYCELVPRVATDFARNLARRSLVSCCV